MTKIGLAILAVLLTIYAVPFVVYGAASVFGGLRPPATASAGRFLLGVLVTKLGTAVAFVVLFSATKSLWGDRWFLYASVWFLMFAFSEVGETISGRTTRVEAALGILSEAIYAPLSAFVVQWLLGRGSS
jgi:hypothetical protein